MFGLCLVTTEHLYCLFTVGYGCHQDFSLLSVMDISGCHLQGASHWTGSIHRFTIIEIGTQTCMECLTIVAQTIMRLMTQVMNRVGHVTSGINTQGRLGGGACRQKVAGSRCAGGLCVKTLPLPTPQLLGRLRI